MLDNDHRFPEVEAPPIVVAETQSIFCLTSKGNGRYVAIVAADTHEQARRFAAESDPFGADWNDPDKFECVHTIDLQDHVVGDVVFQSTPEKALR